MIVRAANGGDVQRLAEFPSTPRAPGWVSVAERWLTGQAWSWSRSTPDARLLVAVDRDQLVGAVGLLPWSSPDQATAGTWTIRGFAVARSARHRGIGTQLLGEAAVVAAANGAHLLFWRAHAEHVVAHELAMKAGAAIAGTAGPEVVFTLRLA